MTTAAASHGSGSRRAMKALGWLVGAGALLAAALIGCLVIFESSSFLGFAINADTLHLALTVWDYSAHDYAREGFSMSRVPSIFPDIAVYATVQLATGGWRMASLAHGALSLLGLSAAAGVIVREIARCGWLAAAQAFLLLTLLALLLELPITATSEHMHIFLPNNHGGPFILALAALGVARSWLLRPARAKLVALFLLVTAGVLSDLLFVISCVGPITAAIAFAVLRRKLALRAAMPIIACVLLGTAASRGLDLLLVRDGGIGIDWTAVPVHARAFAGGIVAVATAAPLTAVLAYALPLAALLASPLLLIGGARQDRAREAVEFWWVLSASSVLATLAAVPLVYEGTWHFRYMMPLLWWPVVWASVWLVRLLGAARRAVLSTALAGLALMLGVAYTSRGLHAPALLALHHPAEACLLEAQQSAGLKAGLGDYWHARYIEASSDWRLQIDQVEPDGAGVWWSNDRFWYTHDVHDGARIPVYNYFVMAGLDETAIKSHYGAPDRTLVCGGSAIWIYDDAAALRRELVRTSPSLYATFLEADEGIDAICIPADRFLSAGHRVENESLAPLAGPLEVRVDAPDASRPQAWSSAFDLPRGRWTLTLRYALTTDTPGHNRWQVTRGWGREVLYEGELAVTGGELRTVETDLTLDEPVPGVEIRSLLLSGAGTVIISGAKIAHAYVGDSLSCEN